MLLLLVLACGDVMVTPEGPGPELAEDPTLPAMDATHLLSRLSLDLRGTRPSLDELAAVSADPTRVDTYAEEWLQDERFGASVRRLFSDVYLTRQDAFFVTAADFGLDDEPGFAASVGEEPLAILGYVAEHDLPYSTIVTADWTMADERLGAAFPLDYPEGATGWQQARYTDGRPGAGVLTTNSMWWRYMSSLANGNRGRANAISKTLLCSDYLSRPITFDRNVNILDTEALNDALQNNPGCVACHASLDPLAAYLWGFYFYDYSYAPEISTYHAEREKMWDDYAGGVGPAYYGEPGYTLADLGAQIADDPRFESCAVERVYGGLLQRELELEDTAATLTHLAAFQAGGQTLRALYRSVIRSAEYRAAATDDPAAAPLKLVSPEQLASTVEDLTGYRFTYAGYDMLQTDTYGVRILAGGVDGLFVSAPARAPTATMVLVQERLAEGAARHVVTHDRQHPEAPTLFTRVRFAETPSSNREVMAAQIQDLHLRLFGDVVAADGPEVTANLELWSELYAIDHSPAEAWVGLLSVLLRDPLFLVY